MSDSNLKIYSITEENFSDLFYETFVTTLSDASMVELVNDGKNKKVTY